MSKEIRVEEVDDFHVHLRQGTLMELVTPLVAPGGCRLAYVMPNLTPPITTTAQALEYKRKLQQLSPNTEFLMTLYLNPSLTSNEIEKAAANGISGVKSGEPTGNIKGIS